MLLSAEREVPQRSVAVASETSVASTFEGGEAEFLFAKLSPIDQEAVHGGALHI